MSFDLERLAALAKNGYLRRIRHPEADLWIYNYTEKTQYEGHWTPDTMACRGLILDAEGAVVARGFPKFFNYGDPAAGEIPAGTTFRATEKIDGSLGILYCLGDEHFLATRGSFVSDQAREGTKLLNDYELSYEPGTTPLFEIVYPENRIVVDYGDRRELFLLGAVWNSNGRDVAPMPRFSGPRVEVHRQVSFEELLASERPNREGYVLSFNGGEKRLKIKHEEYKRLHKIVTGLNRRVVWEAVRDGNFEELLSGVPDEFYRWADKIRTRLILDFERIAAVNEAIFDARPRSVPRKMLAAYFLNGEGNAGILFRMLDDKPYADIVWKMLKPDPMEEEDSTQP